jgi:hypothetical protein
MLPPASVTTVAAGLICVLYRDEEPRKLGERKREAVVGMVNSTPIVLESGAQLNIPPSHVVHYVTTVLYTTAGPIWDST